MKRRVNSRKGSALLVVLGMLSFMVVSAVAFSMFMRENRLPSSFLRQKIVSGHLVKAALAKAMDEIDSAIGSHPYPGVSESSTGQSRGRGGERNYWKNRVFMGVSGEGLEEWSADTVSPLTLEALAYLPPPLINTVRYWSRRTPTAQWHKLGYDAGRYAYAAVNVSDYLDINRLRANMMRDSSPSNRISSAYLFENQQHTGPASGASPEKFDDFIKRTCEGDDFKTRLVSLADYNLAIKSGQYGDIGFESPFCEYFSGNGGDGLLYGDVSLDTIKRQQFVTDSWYPGQATNNVIYLTDDQPFDDAEDMSFERLQRSTGGECYKRLRQQLDTVAFAALYDYVDEDSVPISLAIPTIERAPMFTGLNVMAEGFGITMAKSDVRTERKQGNQSIPHVVRTWKMNSLGSGSLTVAAHGVYPFRRNSGRSEPTSYKVEVLVKAFLSSGDFDFTKTRYPNLKLRPRNRSEWQAESAMADSQKAWVTAIGKGSATFSGSRDSAEDCKVNVSVNDITIPGNAVEGLDVFSLEFDDGDEENARYYADGIVKPLYFYDSNGRIKSIKETLPSSGLKLNLAFWFRIVDGDGKTVDLVPATLADDETYNNFRSLYDEEDEDIIEVCCGRGEPVLPMSSSPLLTAVDLETYKANIDVETPGKADDEPTFNEFQIFCADPRFNFAPEDWYTTDSMNWSSWLSQAKNACNGENGKPRDLFQFVSDCGYLQSMGELQFLPVTARNQRQAFRSYPARGTSTGFDCDYLKGASKYNGAFASDISNIANKDYVWRTHWAFGPHADWASDRMRSPYMWGILDTRDGAVVTPYSASDDLLMAGLANTPYDWRVAGLAQDGEFTASDIGKYCFNGYSGSEAPFPWQDLCDVAAGMRESFLEGEGWSTDLGGNRSTSDTWNDYWYKEGEFFGASNDDIDDVDRRYLYSYWKNCFGDRQQLFLVFVRAEPSVLGGSTGRTPAQMGARAVALVWREPVSSLGESSSGGVQAHRMRILFYHQFE